MHIVDSHLHLVGSRPVQLPLARRCAVTRPRLVPRRLLGRSAGRRHHGCRTCRGGRRRSGSRARNRLGRCLSRTRYRGRWASCRPEEQGFAAYLERISAVPKLRGLRRILHTSPDDVGQRPLFAEHLRLLPHYGLTFDICVLARQLPIALHLARSCPDLQFILDHCGVPDVRGAGTRTPGAPTSRPWLACPMWPARSRGWSPTRNRTAGRSRISGLLSNMRSQSSAGTACSGAAIGRCAG